MTLNFKRSMSDSQQCFVKHFSEQQWMRNPLKYYHKICQSLRERTHKWKYLLFIGKLEYFDGFCPEIGAKFIVVNLQITSTVPLKMMEGGEVRLTDLPAEILVNILLYLDLQSINQLEKVCFQLQELIATSLQIWKQGCLFSLKIISTAFLPGYEECFLNALILVENQ